MQKKIKSFVLLSTVLILVSFQLNSSPAPFEFGKIRASEIDLEHFREQYPDEPAVIIGDIATCRFAYNNTRKGFQFIFAREMRMIILTEQGLDYGDFSIPFYQSENGKENIKNFRAHVYNVNNGRLTRERIRANAGFEKDAPNNWKELSFAFPQVKVGSVIEVRYEIVSDFLFQMRNWQVQKRIPVIHSEYTVNLPSFFIYMARLKGFIAPDITEQSESKVIFRIENPARAYADNRNTGTFSVLSTSNLFRWVFKDVKPFEEEPYTDNIRNYQAALFFEFTREEYPKADTVHFSTTWEDVSKYLLKHKNFGKYLEESKAAVRHLLPENTPDELEEKVMLALKIISEKIRWNNDETSLADHTPAKVLANETGNSAEINLLLTALLREMNIQAYPVAVSTVSNGNLISDLPTITQWNYVITYVKLPDGKELLLDATPPHPAPGFLPYRATNRFGRIIDLEVNQWVDLETNIEFTERKKYNLTINESGDLTGSYEMLASGYAKFLLLNQIAGSGEERFWDSFKEKTGAGIKENAVVLNADNDEPLIISTEIMIPLYAQKIGNEFMLHSLLTETEEENIFKSEERLYPVFFPYLLKSQLEINLHLPENFAITHLPEDKNLRWGRISHIISFQETEEGIRILSQDIRNVRNVPATNYNGFRRFMDRKIANNIEGIILQVN